jgi:hypothetical protein
VSEKPLCPSLSDPSLGPKTVKLFRDLPRPKTHNLMQLLPRPKDAATTCAVPEEKDISPPDPRNDLQDGIGTLGGWKLYAYWVHFLFSTFLAHPMRS